ncbi:uncharacterized protein LOC108593728 [Callithrix jacchus]
MASSSFQGSPQKRAVDVNKPENQGPVGCSVRRMFILLTKPECEACGGDGEKTGGPSYQGPRQPSLSGTVLEGFMKREDPIRALELQGVQCGRGAIFHSTKFQINTSPRKTPCEDPQQTSARPDEPWVRGGVDADLSGRGEGCGGVGVEVPGARSLRLPGCLRGPHRGWERSAGKRKGRRSPSGRRASGSFAPPKERGGSAVLLTTRPPPPCYRSPGPVGADTGDPLRGRGARWTLAAGSRARSCRRLPLLPRPSLSREKRCSGDLGPSLGVCAGPYPNPPREEARRGGPRCGGGKLRRDARLENATHGGAGWTPSVLQEPAGAKPQPATQSQAQTHVA